MRKKQRNKIKRNLIFTISLIILFSLSINLTYAENFPFFNVCCEKTIDNAWCQNTLEENCNSDFRITPTSCEATSFCSLGCCFDSSEGLCMENTPERVCNEQGGVWNGDSECNIPQCELGCCVLGEQASFVTLTRCKQLSSFYGLNTDFRTNINDELSCIAIAQSSDKGACVYETEDFERTCRFTTRGECEGDFYKDYLCSSEELATNCGMTKDTICVPGKDEVYFVDSCGNPANIYDAEKIEEQSYWNKIISKQDSCVLNKNDKSCGNCDYFKGSICGNGNAVYGNNVCKDLSCETEINGKKVTKKNGESWCVYDGNIGSGVDTVGSRHFRYVCIQGEVTIEPCADYRNEYCYEDKVKINNGEFTEAACRINRWRDCLDQKEEEDCLNTDKRDCYWLKGLKILGLQTTSETEESTNVFNNGNTGGFQGGFTGNVITGKATQELEESGVQLGGKGICLPEIPPGLKFWESGDSQSVCGLGNSVCVVKYEEKLYGDKECVENCQCLTQEYAVKMNQVCSSLGDCGAYINYIGEYSDNGIELKINKKKKNLEKSGISNAILNDIKKRV